MSKDSEASISERASAGFGGGGDGARTQKRASVRGLLGVVGAEQGLRRREHQ